MSTITSQVNEVEGLELPAPGVFEIDASHTHVGFVVRHMMVSKVKGRFTSFEGKIEVGSEPSSSSVEVTIDATSVDSHDEKRDAHLRSPDFLDVEQFPTLAFRSTKLVPAGERSFALEGELTLHGVTKPIVLAVEQEGSVVDPYGNERIGFSATSELNREDFGITFNMALETGGVVVGKSVKLELEIEAVRAKSQD
jgi:polyisoprenoid-binding protein YceI